MVIILSNNSSIGSLVSPFSTSIYVNMNLNAADPMKKPLAGEKGLGFVRIRLYHMY